MRFTNTHLQRIHWAVFSPSLLSYPFCTNYIRDEAHRKAVLRLLQQLNQEPELVDGHFAELRGLRMGKYFEQLLFFILEQDDRFEVLLKNHQLLEGKRTTGEIDLIIKDTQTEKIEHWEIALKYYLQRDPSELHELMIGPNGNDTLAKKMQKLTKHQLPITADLSAFGMADNSVISNRLLLKGQFFYHISHIEARNIFPSNANAGHEWGWWCRLSETESTMGKDLAWTILRKPNWIGRVNDTNPDNLFKFSEMQELLTQHFQDTSYAVLCVGLKLEDGTWKENSRGFVVHDDWPSS